MIYDFSRVQHVAFDADDTLWQNEDFYHATETDFGDLFAPFVGHENACAALARTESKNMELLGYGAKAMTLSMIETAAQLVPNPSSELINSVLEIGTRLLRMPTILLPGALETVQHLMQRTHVFILTKGDLLEQERKFENSPFKALGLEYICISGKDPEDYSKVLQSLNIAPDTFMMVGNSPRSDVQAPLSLGAYAAYVPYKITWSHEHTELTPNPRLIQLSAIRELCNYFI